MATSHPPPLVVPPSPVRPSGPPHRGKLLTANQVQARWFPHRSVGWIHRRVPGRRAFGTHTFRWVEYDVIDWFTREVGYDETAEPPTGKPNTLVEWISRSARFE